jgi:hypothetical protein
MQYRLLCVLMMFATHAPPYRNGHTPIQAALKNAYWQSQEKISELVTFLRSVGATE